MRKIACTLWGYFIYRVANNDYQWPVSHFASLELRPCYEQKWQSKTSDWIHLDWNNQSISYITVCENISLQKHSSFAIDIPEKTYFHYIRQINHSLLKDRGSIVNVWQDSEFNSAAGNNLRKAPYQMLNRVLNLSL